MQKKKILTWNQKFASDWTLTGSTCLVLGMLFKWGRGKFGGGSRSQSLQIFRSLRLTSETFHFFFIGHLVNLVHFQFEF